MASRSLGRVALAAGIWMGASGCAERTTGNECVGADYDEIVEQSERTDIPDRELCTQTRVHLEGILCNLESIDWNTVLEGYGTSHIEDGNMVTYSNQLTSEAGGTADCYLGVDPESQQTVVAGCFVVLPSGTEIDIWTDKQDPPYQSVGTWLYHDESGPYLELQKISDPSEQHPNLTPGIPNATLGQGFIENIKSANCPELAIEMDQIEDRVEELAQRIISVD